MATDEQQAIVPKADTPPLDDLVRGWLGAGGVLAASRDGYEERAEQLAMSLAVSRAIELGEHAVLEAGTGTGKTLAYLVPAIMSGKKVVVSTATKALQEQLVEKDLPALQKLGARFSFAVMKGRSNYLCQLRQEQFDAAPVFVSRDEASRYVKLRTWATQTQTGDRAELDLPDSYVAWRDVSSTTETCLGQECPKYQSCHVTRMRQRASEADVVVVNHHLFFADLALKGSPAAKAGAEIIPRYEAVVFDEAHNVEDVATEFFGAQVSNWRFFDLCRDVDRAVKAKAPSWPAEPFAQRTASLGRAVDAYFAGVASLAPADVVKSRETQQKYAKPSPPPPPAPKPEPTTMSLFGKRDAPRETAASDAEVLARAQVIEIPEGETDADRRESIRWTLETGALDSLKELRDGLFGELTALRMMLEPLTKDTSEPEAEGFVRRCDELRASMDAFSGTFDTKLVYWAEQRGRGVHLRAAPVDVAGYLRRALFSQAQPVILTSATLATGGDTMFFQRRVGLTDASGHVRPTKDAVFPSPFDYARQAALYLPRHLPDPSDPGFAEAAIPDIAALIALAKGRTFVLFTSFRQMNEVHRRLASRIPYQVLLQGQKPKGALVRDFKEKPSVLFATQSFWEGVDVQGDMLSMVVIDKLPFASPGDPLVAARLQAIEERGGSAFGEYQLPAAAIALKQGFGRLIRSRKDTGAVAILDRRLWTKGYGGYLRKSLPACPTFDRFGDLKGWWKDVRAHET